MRTLASATLDARERRALERAVAVLEKELGDDLLAVWLYGSRARGEIPHPESDVDLIVIVRDRRQERRVSELVWKAAEGLSSSWFSVHVFDPAWVADRRAIESFFMQEVDRDKVVLAGAGDELPGLPPSKGYASTPKGPAGMSLRSWAYLEKAWSRLELAEDAFEAGKDRSAVASLAYYAMLYAAQAALSEEDVSARTHSGTWLRFREAFVATGRFDEALVTAAQGAQKLREAADYEALTPESEQAASLLADARSFVDAVNAMLGVEGASN